MLNPLWLLFTIVVWLKSLLALQFFRILNEPDVKFVLKSYAFKSINNDDPSLEDWMKKDDSFNLSSFLCRMQSYLYRTNKA